MFKLSPYQRNKLKEWKSSHKETYEGSVGGRYTYAFTPTSVGVHIIVIDNSTKTSIDLSNYEEW